MRSIATTGSRQIQVFAVDGTQKSQIMVPAACATNELASAMVKIERISKNVRAA